LALYKLVSSAFGWFVSDKVSEINLKLKGETKKRMRNINDAPELKLSLTLTFITIITITMVLLVLNTGPINLFVCTMMAIYVISGISIVLIVYRHFVFKHISRTLSSSGTKNNTTGGSQKSTKRSKK